MASRSKRKRQRAAQNSGQPVIVYNPEFIQPLTDEARARVEAHERLHMEYREIIRQRTDKAIIVAEELIPRTPESEAALLVHELHYQETQSRGPWKKD
jgi:hypothetical protein